MRTLLVVNSQAALPTPYSGALLYPAVSALPVHMLPACLCHLVDPVAPAARIFVHHYTEFMEASGFDAAAECLNSLIADYRRADGAGPAPVTRMRPCGLSFI
jgi:hypothetical protein